MFHITMSAIRWRVHYDMTDLNKLKRPTHTYTHHFIISKDKITFDDTLKLPPPPPPPPPTGSDSDSP